MPLTHSNHSLHSPLFGGLLLSLLAAGCGKSPTEPAVSPVPERTVVATSPTPVRVDASMPPPMKAEPLREEEITFTPKNLRTDPETGFLMFCLDCSVRKATYTYCLLDPSEARKVAVDPATAIRVRVEMTPKASKNYVPEDPHAPQPTGGFVHEMFNCRILNTTGEPPSSAKNNTGS